MKKYFAIPLSIALVLSMSNAFATDPVLNEGVVFLEPTASVTRHCALSLIDMNGTDVAQVGYEIGAEQLAGGEAGDGLNFGDIYKDQSISTEAVVKRTAHVYVQCNDDFRITAISAGGGLKLDGSAAVNLAKASSQNAGTNKNLDYQVSEVSVGSMKLINGAAIDAVPVMASSLVGAGQSRRIKLSDAQQPVASGGLATNTVDTQGKIELSVKKGQYPQGGYTDTITIELAAY